MKRQSGDTVHLNTMTALERELLLTMEEISEDSFSAGWALRLEEVIGRMALGGPWCAGEFDGESCSAPSGEKCCRLGYLIGDLGGYWSYTDGFYFKWLSLEEN